jgi:hypothetical protein
VSRPEGVRIAPNILSLIYHNITSGVPFDEKTFMKNITLLSLLLYALSGAASKTDTTFHHNQIGLSITNAMSQEFCEGANHKPTASPSFYTDNGISSLHYLPVYALHLQLRYTVDISRGYGIETGLGYLLNMTLNDLEESASGAAIERVSRQLVTTGYITLPLYARYTRVIHQGALHFKLGPDFSLPVNVRSATSYDLASLTANNNVYTHRLSANETGQNAMIGLCAGMSYEKKLQRGMSVSVGPVLDFFNMDLFHKINTLTNYYGYHSYQYYVGLDVAVNFGFRLVTKSGRY